MAWFGESLSSLTGHLQNFTKEVLSEASETKGAVGDTKATNEKLEELEGICAAQDLEISALKKQNAELHRRLELAGCLEDGAQVVPPAAATWLSVEQRCDAAYTAGAAAAGPGARRSHARALSDATAVAAKHQERLEKELNERIQLIEHLQIQLQKIELERHELSQKSSKLEQHVQELTRQVISQEEIIKERRSSALQIEDKLVQENSELRIMLNDANKRTQDLEEELLVMRNQCLDHVIDSQVNTSELRLDVEQTRKRIANEAGVQRAEKLRAHQDMVNRMIQMGEKTRECEENVKTLQGEDQKLAAEMASKIQKLGDQEQQELIQGTLKALELENQVLNMRNAQLERESLKALELKIEEGSKAVPDGIYLKNRNNDASKSEMKDDLMHEKSLLLEQVQLLQEKLQEQRKKTSNKLQEQDHSANLASLGKIKELEQELTKSRETIKLLCEEKRCVGQELEAMARVVQDLESKVTLTEEERQDLVVSMEELDQQHQDALDKLIALRNSELVENEHLKLQIQELKLAVKQSECSESYVQTDIVQLILSDSMTQTDGVNQNNQENQTSFGHCDKAISTEGSRNHDTLCDVDVISKYDVELCEEIKKSINFEISSDSNHSVPQSLHLVQEIIKVANECKWKKSTLERKVAELIRENKEYKSTITILETECLNLRENVERLAEQLVGAASSSGEALPMIPENSEEAEVLEQKNTMLEEKVAVLDETRINLEKDAARLREERDDLMGRIRNFEAQIRNQENLQTESQRHVENASRTADEYRAALDIAENLRMSAEEKVNCLSHELEIKVQNHEKQLLELKEIASNLDTKNRELVEEKLKKEAELDQCQRNLAELNSERNSLIFQLQQNKQETEKYETVLEERLAQQLLVSDLQVQLRDTEEMKTQFTKVSEDLKQQLTVKEELEHKLEFTLKSLHDAQLLIKREDELDAEMKNWQDALAKEELKAKEALESVLRLEKENEILKDRLANEELSVKKLVSNNKQCVKEITELRDNLDKELNNQRNCETLKVTIEELQSQVNNLRNAKNELEQTLSTVMSEMEFYKKEKSEEIEQLKLCILQKEENEALMQQNILTASNEAKASKEELEMLKEENSQRVKYLEKENESLKIKLATLESNKCDALQLTETIKYLESQLHILLTEKDTLVEENSKLKFSELETDNKFVNGNSTQQNNMQLSENYNFDKGGELKQLREEKQVTASLLKEKNQEIELLQTKLKDLSVVLEEQRETIKDLALQKELILNEKSQSDDKFAMTKESVTKLSEMIKERDVELAEIKQEISHLRIEAQQSESISKQLSQAQEAAAHMLQERDQLLHTVHVKHQESLQYHAEIQRLSTLLGQEMAKRQQLSEERVNGSPLHVQEMSQLQELLKAKDEGLHQLCSRLELKEQELQARGMEMETLQHQVMLMAQERMVQHAAGDPQEENYQEKYAELLSKFQDEQRKSKNLQNEFEISQGKEFALLKELERLRVHLVEIEDIYTQEALKSEEQMKELANKLQQAEEVMKSSSSVYKSANIRANQQVETLQEQARLIAQQRDDVQMKLSAAEDKVAKHAAALRNLQAVLEQFQRDREREIEAARASVYVKVDVAQKRHDELLGEISSLKLQLKEAKEGLSAASRLGEELERKTEIVNRLKQEVVLLQEKVQKSKEEVKTVGQNAVGKVDKSLVKNVVLGFFLAPTNSKEQVLQVVASVLEFSDDEKNRIQKHLGLPGSVGSGGWFKSLLHPSGQSQSNSQSLSEAFVRFLENESIPQPKLKMLPEAERKLSSSASSPRATPPVNARKSPLLLADVQLPTFAQFPVGRNSSSILKDILKES